MLDGAYILHRKTLRKTDKVEASREGELTRGDYIVLAIIVLDCLVFGTLSTNHILVIPLAYSLLIGLILTVVAVLVYITGVRKWRRERKKGRKIYSIRQFLFELAIASVVFLPAYLAGVGLLESLAIALYIYLLIHWYYNFKPHIRFPRKYLILRSVLVFSGTFLGWLTLVKANTIVYFLIAALTAFMLAKAVGFEEMERRFNRAGAIFQPFGLIYGMLVGVMVASNIYGTWYFVLWIVTLYRLAYIFTPPFLTIEAPIGWIYVKSGMVK